MKLWHYCPNCNSNHPSMLWVVMSQVTVLCVLLACMYHWHHVQYWLEAHVWKSGFWRTLGFILPGLATSGFIILCELHCRMVNKRRSK